MLPALLELGEELERARDAALRVLLGERVGRDAEVVLDRQPGQQPPALGHDRDAGAADLLGPPAREVVRRPAARGRWSTRSTPPTASTSDDLPAPFGPSSVVISPGGIVERDVVQHAPSAARDAQLLEAQLRAGGRRCGARRSRRARVIVGASTSSVPRYARMTFSSRSTSAVGPVAISLPKSSTAVVAQHAWTRLMSWSTRITSAPNCSGIFWITPLRCSVSSSGQPGGRLVEQHDLGRADDGARDLDEAPVAGAEPADLDARGDLEADVLDRARGRRPAATRARRPSARGSSRCCRTPTAARSPSRSGTCAAGPSARAGSRPS